MQVVEKIDESCGNPIKKEVVESWKLWKISENFHRFFPQLPSDFSTTFFDFFHNLHKFELSTTSFLIFHNFLFGHRNLSTTSFFVSTTLLKFRNLENFPQLAKNVHSTTFSTILKGGNFVLTPWYSSQE